MTDQTNVQYGKVYVIGCYPIAHLAEYIGHSIS